MTRCSDASRTITSVIKKITASEMSTRNSADYLSTRLTEFKSNNLVTAIHHCCGAGPRSHSKRAHHRRWASPATPPRLRSCRVEGTRCRRHTAKTPSPMVRCSCRHPSKRCRQPSAFSLMKRCLILNSSQYFRACWSVSSI